MHRPLPEAPHTGSHCRYRTSNQDALGDGLPSAFSADSLHPHGPSLELPGICALPWGPHRKLGQEKGRNWPKTTQPGAGEGRGGELKLEPRALPHLPGFPDYLSGRCDTPGR